MAEKKEYSLQEKRAIANRRAEELKSYVEPYLQARKLIPDGFSSWEIIQERQQKI